MKKLLLLLLSLPAMSFADRLGSLRSNADVLLTTQAVSTTPGGSNTQVQFNNTGTLGGSPNFTYNGVGVAVQGSGSFSPVFTAISSGTGALSNAGLFQKATGSTAPALRASSVGSTITAAAFDSQGVAIDVTSGATLLEGTTSFVTGSNGLIVSYGVSAGSITVQGSGGVAGGASITEGTSSSGVSGQDIIQANSSTHAMEISNNGGSFGRIVTSTITPTIGHIASWSGTGQIVDGGVVSSSSGSGAQLVSQLLDCQVTRQNSNTLIIGSTSSVTGACNVKVGGTVYPIISSGAVVIGASSTGVARIFVSGISGAGTVGTFQVGNNGSSGMTCSAGCAVQTSIAAFPGSVIPLAIWNATSAGVWDSTGTDLRSVLGVKPSPIAGNNIMITAGDQDTISAIAGGVNAQVLYNSSGSIAGTTFETITTSSISFNNISSMTIVGFSTMTFQSGTALDVSAASIVMSTATFNANTFASLGGSAGNGSFLYCSDCTVTTSATCVGVISAACVCAGSGNGAFAKRLNGSWYCN